MQKEIIAVKGMSCEHCENRVQKALLAIDGVAKCKASAKKGEVKISFDETKTTIDAIKAVITETGYEA